MSLATPSGTLYGSLLVPTQGPWRAGRPWVMVIIAGSGPTDRDGNSLLIHGANNNLKMLAQALAAQGVASLRYDKRGVAQSAGALKAESEIRFDDLIDDASAWVKQLALDPRFAGVGVIGHSEGAAIAAEVARSTPQVGALLSVSGVGTTAVATLRRQLAGKLPPDLAASSDAILNALEQGRTVADVPRPLMPLFRPAVQPYLISRTRHSPTQTIAAVQVPCLIVQGETDIQVTVDDANALAAAQPRCRLALIAGMNHVLKVAPVERVANLQTYGLPDLPLAPGFMEAVQGFLGSVGAGRVRTPP